MSRPSIAGFSIDIRRTNIVEPAFQVYVLTKGVAGNPDRTSAAEHTANLPRKIEESVKEGDSHGSSSP